MTYLYITIAPIFNDLTIYRVSCNPLDNYLLMGLLTLAFNIREARGSFEMTSQLSQACEYLSPKTHPHSN